MDYKAEHSMRIKTSSKAKSEVLQHFLIGEVNFEDFYLQTFRFWRRHCVHQSLEDDNLGQC